MSKSPAKYSVTFGPGKQVTLSDEKKNQETLSCHYLVRDPNLLQQGQSRFVVIETDLKNTASVRKRKFDQSGFDSLFSELQAYLDCNMINQQEYNQFRASVCLVDDKDGYRYYGIDMPYFPGKTLQNWIEEVADSDRTPDEKKQAVLAMSLGALDAYCNLNGYVVSDYSLNNMVVNELSNGEKEYYPIDFADLLTRHNHACGEDVYTFNDDVAESILARRHIRQKYNQRFFYAFHCLLLKSLQMVSSTAIESQFSMHLVADLVPNSGRYESTQALFKYYHDVLLTLMEEESKQPPEALSNRFDVESLLWSKAIKIRDSLSQLAARLSQLQLPDTAEVTQQISNFTQKITADKPDALQAAKLYLEGVACVTALAKHAAVAKHRVGDSYRGRGRNSVLTMGHGKRAAIVFGGLLIIGLLVLLGMYLFAIHRTGRQQLLHKLTQLSVCLQVAQRKEALARVDSERQGSGSPAGQKPVNSVARSSVFSCGVSSDSSSGIVTKNS